MYVGTYTMARGEHRASYSIPFCLVLLRRALSLSLELGWQAASTATLLSLLQTAMGLPGILTATDISTSARDPNSGPHAYAAIAPSHQAISPAPWDLVVMISCFSFQQVKSGSIFDNFLLTNDEEFAEEVGNMTWGLRKVRCVPSP